MNLSQEITLKQAREVLLKKHAAALHRIRELVTDNVPRDPSELAKARGVEREMAEDLLRLDQRIRHVTPIVEREQLMHWQDPLHVQKPQKP